MNEKGIGNKGGKGVERRVLVALWMNGVFGQETIEGIHEWLRESGARWRIRFADSASLYFSSLNWMLREDSLDGTITYSWGREGLALLRRAGIPAVVIRHDDTDDEARHRGMAFVTPDLGAIARVCVDHFLSRADFRSAGFVESYFDHGWSRRRGEAMSVAFARRGVEMRHFLHYGRISCESAAGGPDFDGLAAWLRDLPKPAAVVAASDATGVDVINLCAAQGIAVPREVSVLGMDDNPVFCQHSLPNLSSVHFDARRAGRLAAEALDALMRGSPAPNALLYGASSIAARASSAATPSAGEIVQRALDYIDANACSGATLSDVVRHCRHSRTLVTLRFRQMTGRSVEQALKTRRIDEARRLLRETSFSAEEICGRCGYDNASALRRAFVQETGLTMGAFRRSYRP